MAITCCFIKEQYFIDNAHFSKMLDSGNTGKQSHRVHLCIRVIADSSTFYLPLRNNLGADVRKFAAPCNTPKGRRGRFAPCLIEK